MKRQIRNTAILLLPFLMMIIINELVRPTIAEKPTNINGVAAINSALQTPSKCSWICHNSTNYCKKHHVKLMDDYFEYTDPIYWGFIGLLKSTGNYGLANIALFVVLLPLLMYFLLIKSIDLQSEIKKLQATPKIKNK
ncbi:MAG: hypothetical protein ACPG49_03675 [Chitinophagales bacterium]